MVRTRPRSKHARKLAIALGLSVAAGAMAHTLVGGQHHRSGDGAGVALQVAGGGHAQGDGGGGQGAGGGGDSGGGGGVGASTGGPQDLTEAGRQAAYGPGEDHDGPNGAGFMPNGEDGLMMLADYARAQGDDSAGADSDDSNSDQIPGTAPDGEATGFPIAGQDAPGPIGANGDGPTPGGFGGFGFGGGGGGGAGGSGAGGGKGGGGGSAGPVGGSSTGPGAGLPSGGGTGPTSDSGPPRPSGGGDGGKICVVSALDTCGQPPAGPILTPQLSAPTLPPGGGANSDAAQVITTVPEPSVWLMLTLGFGSLGAAIRRQRREVRATLA